MNIKVFVSIFFILLSINIFPQTSYYISSSTGNDSNSGKSSSAPLKSLSKVSSIHLYPGDKILFKQGDSWVGQLNLKYSGNSSNKIYIGNYGTGSLPILSGNNTQNYVVYLNSNISYITFDGLTFKDCDPLLSKGILYSSSNNSNITINNCTFNQGKLTNNPSYAEIVGYDVSYWTITNSDFSGNSTAIYFQSNYNSHRDVHHINIYSNNFHDINGRQNNGSKYDGQYGKAIRFGSILRNGIGTTIGQEGITRDITINNNKFIKITGPAIYHEDLYDPSKLLSGWSEGYFPWLSAGETTYNIKISNNYSKQVEWYFVCWGAISDRAGKFNWSSVDSNTSVMTGYDANGNQTVIYPVSVIQTHGWDETYIEGNRISQIGCAPQFGENKGIILDFVGSKTDFGCNNLIIRNNIISGNRDGNGRLISAGAIHSYTGKNIKIYNNILYDNKAGINIESTYSSDNLIYNNTIDDNNYGIYYSNGGTNNIFRNNIITNSSVLGLYDTGNIIDDHTLFYSNTTNYKFNNNSTNVFGDPKYKNRTNRDYSILSGSAAIDKGTSNGILLLNDINGVIVSGNPDIGAYQYGTITVPQTPATPVLNSPSDGTTNISISPTLSWNSVNGAASYSLQISSNSSFSSFIFNQSGITSTSKQISGLNYSSTYFWRVNASNSNGTSNWSNSFSLTTGSGTTPPPSSSNSILGAENATLSNGATLTTASGSLGSKVVYCSSYNSTIKLNVNFTTSGTWYVWGRFFWPDGNHNSFRIQVDNGPINTFGNSSPYGEWTWQADGVNNLLSLGTLSSGQHVITIFGREYGPNTLIDRILFTQDPNLNVSDQNLGLSNSGNIILGAENGSLSNGAALTTAAGSIGSKVAYCSSYTSSIKFNVNIPTSGDWYIWGRFLFADGNHDSFRIQVDNGTIYTFGNSDPYGQWTWQADGINNLLIGNLTSGQHTLTILGREYGSSVLVDQVLLTQDPNLNVSDQNLGLSNSGNIILSAENGSLSNGAALTTAAGSIGSKVAYCSSYTSSIKFNVNIPTSGDWYVWGRFFWADGNYNSFRVQVDNGTIYTFGNSNPYGQWTWQADGVGNLLIGNLTSGQHTLTILGREYSSSVLVDQVLLTQNSNFSRNDASLNLTKNNNVSKTEIIKPASFELSQNYPNPFNPTTAIRFSIPTSEKVTLKVYNIIGEEVITLVNEIKSAGTYNIIFNGRDIASGVYLYKLITPEFVETKKMLLIK